MKYLTLLLLTLFSSFGWAQFNKTIIQFKDKAGTPFAISNPEDFLSQKSIERRNLYQIPVDSSDLPINPAYIQSVLAIGDINLLSRSKWLNQILILTPDSVTLSKIFDLPFVEKIQSIGNLIKPNHPVEKFRESIFPIDFQSTGTSKVFGDSLSYGAAVDQIKIHNGQFLHNKNFRGDGITIAVLDAGFLNFKNMHAFDSLRMQGKILGERDFVDFDGSVNEDNSHGMNCLSILAANIPGTMVGSATQASYWLIRTENTASEYPVEEFNWVVGAEFADSVGVDIITSSLGYNLFDYAPFNHTYDAFYKNETMVSKGAALAAKKGIIVTNSAGNEGNNTWKYIMFPADTDSICSIGAVNANGIIAGFSSYGYPGKVKPNVVSVGEGTALLNSNDQLQYGNGTSFSNPNLCGLIACLWEAFKEFDNITILNAVYQSCSKFANPDDHYGFGIPDMEKAYLSLKTRQNEALYGQEWLMVTPQMFTDKISVKLIGRINGKCFINLQDENGKQLKEIEIQTELQEVYDTAFNNLQSLPAGKYFVVYKDNLNLASKEVIKFAAIENDFINIAPVPFFNTIKVFLKAPETGNITIRIIDNTGKICGTQNISTVVNNNYFIEFPAGHLTSGVYYVQYIGKFQQSTLIVK